jgi:hypothetical protein
MRAARMAQLQRETIHRLRLGIRGHGGDRFSSDFGGAASGRSSCRIYK